MKIVSLIIALITFSGVLSMDDSDRIYKRNISQCINDANEYKDCSINGDITWYNVDSFCENYNSDKCKDLYQNGLKELPWMSKYFGWCIISN